MMVGGKEIRSKGQCVSGDPYIVCGNGAAFGFQLVKHECVAIADLLISRYKHDGWGVHELLQLLLVFREP